MKPTHIIIVVVVIVLLFGSTKLPELARSLGKSARILKDEVRDLQDDRPAQGNPAPYVAPDVAAAQAQAAQWQDQQAAQAQAQAAQWQAQQAAQMQQWQQTQGQQPDAQAPWLNGATNVVDPNAQNPGATRQN